jgi:uncharacterized protein YndB with AHSA1/START domain
MNIADSVTIGAGTDEVWRVFTDVERWPEWTASVRTVEVVSGGGVEPGARVRIRQPRLPLLTWEVSEVEPGVSWTWVARSPGVVTTARHTLTPQGPGETVVRQVIEQRGPLGAVAGRLSARLTRRYLALEGAGLKARCEAADRA